MRRRQHHTKGFVFSLLLFLVLAAGPITPPAGAEDLELAPGETVNLLAGPHAYDLIKVPATALLSTSGVVTITCDRLDLEGVLQLGGDATIDVTHGNDTPASNDWALFLRNDSQIRCDFHLDGHADDGEAGENGAYPGGNGENATDGANGKDGYRLTLIVEGNMFVNYDSHIQLYGQDAGRGVKGGDAAGGQNGSSANPCGPGGSGGYGGNGSDGGDGGDGGSISVTCSGEIRPQYTGGVGRLHWDVSGGHGDSGGFAGLAGNAGAGGDCPDTRCDQCFDGGPAGGTGLAGAGGTGGQGGQIFIQADRIFHVYSSSNFPMKANGGYGGSGGGGAQGGSTVYSAGDPCGGGPDECNDGTNTTQGSMGANGEKGGNGGVVDIFTRQEFDPGTLIHHVECNGANGGGANKPGRPGMSRPVETTQMNCLDASNIAGRGGSGGTIRVSAAWAGTFDLQARGGIGGTGADGASWNYHSSDQCPLPGDGGNGAPGGNGGSVFIRASQASFEDPVDVSGGAGGIGGQGGGNHTVFCDLDGDSGQDGPHGIGGVVSGGARTGARTGVIPALGLLLL